MRRRSLVWSALVAMAALGGGACVGEIGDGAGADGAPELEPGDFACTPGDPSETVLPRLSRAQYVTTIRDFVGSLLGESDTDAVMASLASTLTLVPLDGSTDHARLDQAVSQAHVDAQYRLALATARELTFSQERLEAVVGGCVSDGSDEAACLDAFIRRVGYRAHRRPITEDELAFYRDEVFAPADGLEAAAVRDVITVMLLSPNFVYRVENAGDPVDGREDLYALSAHELASRLAYHFWSGPPDDALYAAADNGALLTDEGYATEVDRMLADPRAQATFDVYYAEWLHLNDLAPLEQQLGTPAYDAFVGDDVPTAELRQHVIEDTLDFTRYTTWEGDGGFRQLFMSDLSFAKTPDVAALYGGVPLWNEGTTPQPVPGGTRAGLLTRPAMLATGSTSTHPVLRGRDVRFRMLCDTIADPPADAMDDLPDLDPAMGERERTEATTEQPGSSCVGCHAQMNPIGFNLEAYDSLGRFRAEEVVYAEDGSVVATVPIDTHSTPRLEPGDDTPVSDGVELSARMADSNVARACFARHYFRFTFARAEDAAVDGCELDAVRKSLEEGKSMREVFRDIALSPTFKRRKLGE